MSIGYSQYIIIKGINPGKIVYDNVKLVKGTAGDGFYLVKDGATPEEKVPYTVYLESVEGAK